MKRNRLKSKETIISIYQKGVRYQYLLAIIQAIFFGLLFTFIHDFVFDGQFSFLHLLVFTLTYFIVISILTPFNWKRFLKKHDDIIKSIEE